MSKSTTVRAAAAAAWAATFAAGLLSPLWVTLAALPIYAAIGALLGAPTLVAGQLIALRSRYGPRRPWAVVHVHESPFGGRPVVLGWTGTTGSRWLADLAAEARYQDVVPTRLADNYEQADR